MRRKRIFLNKINVVYESKYKYKLQEKLTLFWKTLRIGRIDKCFANFTVKGKKVGKKTFYLITIPIFERGVVNE